MASLTQTLQVVSISSALTAAGGIATLSAFDIPEIQSQPATRSLPLIRWLFSRGSHIFPTASIVSTAGFASLAYAALPASTNSVAKAVQQVLVAGGPAGYYAAAAALAISIAPFTQFAMIPTNFRLIELNEELGGSRSAKSKKEGAKGGRTVEESIGGKGDVSQWTDVSGPAETTEKRAGEEMEREVQVLLERFARLNWVRAGLIGVGGLLGLVGAVV